MAEPLKGACLCGAIRVEGRGAPGHIGVCHCDQCLKQGAGPFMGVRFADGVFVEGGSPVWFRSSDHAERAFCAVCGTMLFWRMRDSDNPAVNVHLLEDSGALKVGEEMFVDTPPAWYFAPRDVPRLTRAEAFAELDRYLADRTDGQT